MGNIDVVTFGETMVLFEPDQMYPLEHVHRFDKHIGGAESNVSIGLQRLGHSVGWFSKLGNDPFGRFILQSIRAEGVDVSRTTFTNDAPTGLIFKEKRSNENVNVFYYRNHSAASTMEPKDLDHTYLQQAKILHITGITAALSESCKRTIFEAIKIAKEKSLLVVFDPNIRLKLWSKEKARKVLMEIATLSDVILPGIDEGMLMTEKSTPEEIASALNDNGNRIVIVKLGSSGAYYHTSEQSGYVDAFPVKKVIDPVGAGDAFAVGMISGLLNKEPLEKAVLKANALGAIAVGYKGDVEGLPRTEELEDFLNADRQTDVKR